MGGSGTSGAGPVNQPKGRSRSPPRPRSASGRRAGDHPSAESAPRGRGTRAREILKQLRGAAFLDLRSAIDDDVLAQAPRLDLGPLEGDRHPGISLDVLELSLPWIEMRREEIVALDCNPDARHLRGAVSAAHDGRARPPG